MASFDAWIKYYRPDENSPNASISYYTKGAVIGFLLDARLRRATDGAKSLDDLMRLMYERFSGAKGFTPEDLRATGVDVVGSAAGAELRQWLAKALDSTDELDYKRRSTGSACSSGRCPEKPRVWLGTRTRIDGQRTIVTEVRRGSPAADAGLDISDELAAVNDVDVGGKLADRLATFAPGSTVTFTIQRRGAAQRVDVTLGTDPAQLWQLASRPEASVEQTEHLKAWLQD